jgi:transposase-like protein
MNKKYIYRLRISVAKSRSLLKCFSLDVEVSRIAVLTGISRNTINRTLTAIRKRISEFCKLISPFAQGEVEIDKSYMNLRTERTTSTASRNFRCIAKTKFAKFRGIRKPNFYLHLKECEFRFNHRHEELYPLLLKIFRDKPLKLC